MSFRSEISETEISNNIKKSRTLKNKYEKFLMIIES